MDGTKERQLDTVFTARTPGEYRFCFSNEGSWPTNSEKIVDFEIAVEGDSSSHALLPSKQGTSPEQTSGIEESIMKVSRDLSTISRNQKYFRTRENRNFSTVKSTEGRIFNFSVVVSGMMVAMAGLQVFIVRFFFQGARKGKMAFLHLILHSALQFSYCNFGRKSSELIRLRAWQDMCEGSYYLYLFLKQTARDDIFWHWRRLLHRSIFSSKALLILPP